MEYKTALLCPREPASYFCSEPE